MSSLRTTDPTNKEILERYQFLAAAALPFLRVPAEKMQLLPDPDIHGIGTDGWSIYYNPEDRFQAADHQHLLIHCLFLHMAQERRNSRILQDLACDMAAEYLRAEIFQPEGAAAIKRSVKDALPPGTDPYFIPAILEGLKELREDELEDLQNIFRRDDHIYWYKKPAVPPKSVKEAFLAFGQRQIRSDQAEEDLWSRFLKEKLPSVWKEAGKGLEGNTGGTKMFGLTPGSREERMILRQIGKHDFSRYLKRFCVQREELMLDPGSFDYIPYYYGLKNYGNLPFVEPLEYSESNKVEELAIAIDTSGSCHYETVERFLAEIEKILMNSDTFFKKMNIHIIQCDSMIQDHAVIRSYEDWKQYLKELKIKGRGGTDFTPVFRLVEELRQSGSLKDLKGLLYFTDGDGVYPQEKTPYETAFVFTDRRALDYNIPEWIVRLCLDQPAFFRSAGRT